MNILVNCSNLKKGGGLQVADSICCQLDKYPQHKFYAVFSSYMDEIRLRVERISNVTCFVYEIRSSFCSIVLGRDSFLDRLVAQYKIDVVFSVFGPSRWHPKVPHLSGFAMAQLLIPDSPFFSRMGIMERVTWSFWKLVRKWSFQKSSKCFWTENPFITDRLCHYLKDKKVYTVSNYYNQVYDLPDSWKYYKVLPHFDGYTCISIATPFPNKNFGILIDVAKILKKEKPEFKVRFVLTFDESDIPTPIECQDYFYFIGKVDVPECPYLYEQSDIMFMPTLLECFTATYPEAMKMGVPIVTTDLEFAHGLCGDAACYYSAVDPQAAAEAIYKVATDKEYAAQLVANGKEQLKRFDNYEQRANKLIKILEEIVNEQK